MEDQHRFFTRTVNCYPFRGEGFDVEFLLLKKNTASKSHQAGLWQVVSGKREGEEKFWQAALRELEEETSCVPIRLYNLEVESHYDHFRDLICLSPTFAALLSSDAQVKISEEHEDFEWLPFDEALIRLPYPNQRESITRIRFNIVDQEGPLPMEIPLSIWQKT